MKRSDAVRAIIIAGSALLAWFLPSDSSSAQTYPRTEITTQVDELFAEWDGATAPGAVVGIFMDGRIIYSKGYGLANLDYDIPITPQSVLRIGSISKQFVAMCIAILADQGKLSLDDDIRTHIPEMPDYGNQITIRHLLHHTSGIREYLTLVNLIGKPEGSVFGYTTRELVKLLSRQQNLNFEPGSQFSYTNSGYFLLAEIITRVSGMKASAFAQENIFEPLDMTQTRFYDDPNTIIRNQAFGYSPNRDGGYRLDILRSDVIGDLGVITTVEDFLHWDNNFYENKLGAGTNELIRMMFTRGRISNGEELSYALGLEFDSYRGLKTMGHGGSAVGYVAEFLQFPEQRFSVVILSNLSSFRPGRLARQIADLYLADQLSEVQTSNERDRIRPETPEPVERLTPELEPFIGDFYSEELDFVYSFIVEGSTLQLEIRGSKIELAPLSEDHFAWGRRELNFFRDESGIVSGFILEDGDVQGLNFRKVASPRY